jgi:hypothetical protein
MSTIANSDVGQDDTNNNNITRNINNIDNEGKEFSDFITKTREELLAVDLATILNDRKGLALYLSYAKRFPESVIRRALGLVKEIPSEKIRKSRAALFNHLIQKYAQNHKDHRD